MPTISLPENPSLEHLKSQAKLVRDLIRSHDANALAMIDEFHPRFNVADLEQRAIDEFKTSDAQLIIARLYNFASWTQLRDHVRLANGITFNPNAESPASDLQASFVIDACLDYSEGGSTPADRIANAHRLLRDNPSIATASIEAMATVGDHRSLAAAIDANPEAVNAMCGPNSWPPLLYAVYSRITTDQPDWSAAATVELLLERGADPNAGFLWRGLVPPFTALTGAFGGGESHQPWHPDRITIGRMLLDAGADPNDGQLLYNNGIGGQNHDDPAYLQLLVEYGLGTPKNGPWYQQLGKKLRDPAELLYDELEAAAKRNRPTILAYLITLGLDLERPVGRSKLPAARIAAAEGHDAILTLLADAGVDTSLSPEEQALRFVRADKLSELRALLDGEHRLLRKIRRKHPGLCKTVRSDQAPMLDLLLELGFDINDRSNTKTALHHAAEANDVDLARLLIEHGANPDLADTHIGATPWGWANHFGNEETAVYLHPLTNHGQ